MLPLAYANRDSNLLVRSMRELCVKLTPRLSGRELTVTPIRCRLVAAALRIAP